MAIDRKVPASSISQEVVYSFFDALGDSHALREIFAQDATWTVWGNSPLAGTYEGVEQVVDGFHATAAALFDPNFQGKFDILGLIGDGGTVAAEFTYQTRSALGRDYHNHYVEVFEINSDGLIQNVREYMDRQHFGAVCFDLPQ